MTKKGICWGWFLGIAVGGVMVWSGNCAYAQNITLDGTLGPSGILSSQNYIIPQAVGQTVDNNLFHSFGRFGLDAGEIANFQHGCNR